MRNSLYNLAIFTTGLLLAASCAKQEYNAEEAAPSIENMRGGKYKVTISATKQPSEGLTKALELEGKTLTPYWELGETVSVQFAEYWAYDGAKMTVGEIGTLTVDHFEDWGVGIEVAILSGEVELTDFMIDEITYYPDDCYLFLSYPSYPLDWTGQDGTLETIAARYDYATTWCKITGIDQDQNLTLEDVGYYFDPEQSIFKFNFFDRSGNPVNPSRIQIDANGTDNSSGLLYELAFPVWDGNSMGEWVFNQGAITIPLSGNTNEVFASFGLGTNDFSSFNITAIFGETSVTYTKNDFSIAGGRYYSINVTLPVDIIDLSQLTDDYVATGGEIFTGSTDQYVLTIPHNTSVTLLDATIKAPAGKAAITLEGSATINLAGSNNTLEGGTDRPAISISTAMDNSLGYDLDLWGTADLFITGGQNAAGIGAGKDESIGLFRFNLEYCSGNIEITGGENGAGIGGGLVTMPGITLDGFGVNYDEYATLSVYGGDNAAGIGSGFASGPHQVSAGNISVAGEGEIWVCGGKFGAGVGSGYTNSIGRIYVNTSNAYFVGGVYAAGIGCGRGTDSENQLASTCGIIHIYTHEADGILEIASRPYHDHSDSSGRCLLEGGSPAVGAGFNGSTCGDIELNIYQGIALSPIVSSAASAIGTSFSDNATYRSTCGNINVTLNTYDQWWFPLEFEKVAKPGVTQEAIFQDWSQGTSNTYVSDVNVKYHIGPTVFADPVPAIFYPGIMNGTVTINGAYASFFSTDDGIGYYYNQ